MRPYTDSGLRPKLQPKLLDKKNLDEEYLALLKKDSKELFPEIRNINVPDPPRWPSECQVVDKRIRHIYYVPPQDENYNNTNLNETRNPIWNSKPGITVYEYHNTLKCFYKSSENPNVNPSQTNFNTHEDSLMFESRFECGNLAKAVKLPNDYYELYLKSDMYCLGDRQWFYFKITNMKVGKKYRIAIVNMSRDDKLYKDGMRPLIYSTKRAKDHKIGWERCGENMSYYCNTKTRDSDRVKTYTLSFTMEFQYEDDEVFLSYCYPYSYSDLQDFVQHIATNPRTAIFTSLRLLCKTLAGNNVYYLVITDHESDDKQTIVVTARERAMETPSSWIIKGLIELLTDNSDLAKDLRKKFVFKVIPMLNPDGVIVGNSTHSLERKASIVGTRKSVDTNSPIWYTKLMLQKTSEKSKIAMFCICRANFTVHNVCIWGGDKQVDTELFSSLFNEKAMEKYTFKLFNDQVPGEAIQWMLNIPHSFAIEASYAGTCSDKTNTHFTVRDYEHIGHCFCEILLEFYDENIRTGCKKSNSQRFEQPSPTLFTRIQKTIKSTIKSEYEKAVTPYLYEKFVNIQSTEDMTKICMTPPKWPLECQVLNDKIKHIYYVPVIPEPFHEPTKYECRHSVATDRKVVFEYNIDDSKFFTGSDARSHQTLAITDVNEEDVLTFESRFESGNLSKAVQVSAHAYELFLRNDLYMNKQKQWFYFKIGNMKKNITYRFSIVNLSSDEHLFNEGMRPLMYSKFDAIHNNIGWRRCSYDIQCFPNIHQEEDNVEDTTYTLTFTLEFPHEKDEVFIAYSYPYTYEDLQEHLINITQNSLSQFVSVGLLRKTLANNNIYYVLITDPWSNSISKKTIVITARALPLETPSSWVMKGVLEFLTSNTPTSIVLRRQFKFVLIPMLNPDGVIVGNSCYSLMRNAQCESNSLNYRKLLLKKLVKKSDEVLYCDLHAQSLKHNISIYGFDRNSGKYFLTQDYSFDLLQNCNNMKYAVEVSFGGFTCGERAGTHFNVKDYEKVGHDFCKSLLVLNDTKEKRSQGKLAFMFLSIFIFLLIVLKIFLTYKNSNVSMPISINSGN